MQLVTRDSIGPHEPAARQPRVAPADVLVVGQALTARGDRFGSSYWEHVYMGRELGRFMTQDEAGHAARALGRDLPSVGVLAAIDGAFTVNELLVADDQEPVPFGRPPFRQLVIGPDPIRSWTVRTVRNFEPSAERARLLNVIHHGGDDWMQFGPDGIDPTFRSA